jgi:hypothetical protein
MSIATIATAWSGYQAAKWGGLMAVSYNQASAQRTESVRNSIVGGQKLVFDVVLFNEWLNAMNQEDEALADFYYERMGDLVPALDAWIATEPLINPDAPKSPFTMEEYSVSQYEEAQRLETEAAEFFKQGLEYSLFSDGYVLNAVILASVLFFAGVSTRFKRDSSQIIMLVVGGILLLYGLFNIISYPIV